MRRLSTAVDPYLSYWLPAKRTIILKRCDVMVDRRFSGRFWICCSQSTSLEANQVRRIRHQTEQGASKAT